MQRLTWKERQYVTLRVRTECEHLGISAGTSEARMGVADPWWE